MARLPRRLSGAKLFWQEQEGYQVRHLLGRDGAFPAFCSIALWSVNRHWYACQNAIQILAEHSNQDPPVAVRDFAILEWQSRQLLPFRHENQGVCTWAIVLDGSDDPPVYVDLDTGFFAAAVVK